jgi:hypothetical protein
MSQKQRDIQGDHVVIRTSVAGQSTAGTAAEFILGRAPYAFEVTEVRFTPAAGITGANTNYFSLTVRNRGAAGSGTTVAASKDYVSGTNETAWVGGSVTLSATAANRLVTEGDTLTSEKLITGTGLGMPAGVVEVIGRSRG